MPNLGNAWHIPTNPQPRGRGGMRDPIGAVVPGAAITIFSGNQFQGGGNPGNQLQDGSSLLFKRAADANWRTLPLIFQSAEANNKYFAAQIPAGTFGTGDVVQYYLRIAYDDHDTTFLHASGAGNGAVSQTTESEAVAQAAPFGFTIEDSAVKGQWAPVFDLPNVAIHASVLPNRHVLMWGRRDTNNLDDHACTPFVWNPKDPNPTTTAGTIPQQLQVNLFCSGHAFLPDGRLLVVGGHNFDSDGLNQAMLYDWKTNQWTPTAPMGAGDTLRRWYPTATTLPNGSVLVLSGSYIDPARPQNQQTVVVDLLQIWENGTWKTIKQANGADLRFIGLPLYPRMHVASDGRVFMSGTNAETFLLKTSQPGGWSGVGLRAMNNRDYCPAVMYDKDKIIYIGGGNDLGTQRPTREVEVMDLGRNPRQWRKTTPMKFRRRQHNAVLLPDGTVLVTGGTQGGGGPNNGFNDLRPGQPVHIAEMWNPATGAWTELAAEEVDRCYHATAVLLPDGRVLSAGGGEYRPDNINPNDPQDSHRNAQLFSPPYLFKGNRPQITAAPKVVDYGDGFQVGTSQPDQIAKVSWIRLPSVTHSFDQNQRINFLDFTANDGGLTVTAPPSSNECPPGHYMLFILNTAGVPSEAEIIQIQAAAAPGEATPGEATPGEATPATLTAITPDTLTAQPLLALSAVGSGPGDSSEPVGSSEPTSYLPLYDHEAEIIKAAKGTLVTIGITGTCPYGIGACWGGAYHALRRLESVDLVVPVPNTDNSTAEVFLKDEGLPALEKWSEQFRNIVNGTYELRGVEVTVQGNIEKRGGQLFLAGKAQRPEVQLVPLEAADKVQWNHDARTRKPLEEEEALAYERLDAACRDLHDELQIRVTGPLKQVDTGSHRGYQLCVRLFEI